MDKNSSSKSQRNVSSDVVTYRDMGKRQEGNTVGTEISKEAAIRLHFQPFLSTFVEDVSIGNILWLTSNWS